jgi:DNA polymerase III subunit beta
MQSTLERSQFLRALTHVQSVVERRNTIPILSNVRLQAAHGEIRLTATDLDIEMVESVAAEVSRDGAFTVPAHMLYDIVRKLPEGGQIDIEQGADKGRVVVTSGKSRFTLQALPAEDFPDLASGEFNHNFKIDVGGLKTLIDKTRFAISTEETRYYLNGIYLHEVASGPFLRAVATDGHRLAQSELARPEGASGMPGVIVPRKTVQELTKLLEGREGEADCAVSASKIRISFGQLVLTSKLIDGTFPDYERVIPRNNDKILDIETKDFAAAVDRVSTISQEKSRAVKMGLSDGKVTLVTNNPDSGSAEEELAASYDAGPLEVGFNSRYLLDVAGQIKAETMRFELQDAGSPTIVRDPSDQHSLYVLMPMRV